MNGAGQATQPCDEDASCAAIGPCTFAERVRMVIDKQRSSASIAARIPEDCMLWRDQSLRRSRPPDGSDDGSVPVEETGEHAGEVPLPLEHAGENAATVSAAGSASPNESAEAPCCWVCLDTAGELLRGCACRGTSGYAHIVCIENFTMYRSDDEFDGCPTCRHAYHTHICTRVGATPATFPSGLGPSRPHLRRDLRASAGKCTLGRSSSPRRARA